MWGIDQYTKLMLHMNGVDESTTFIDSEIIPKTVIAYDGAQIDTAQGKFGGIPPPSGLFDGIGSYLYLDDSDDFYFGTDNFTIDFWVRFNDLTDETNFLSQYWVDGNFWKINKQSNVNGNKLSLEFIIDDSVMGSYIMSSAWSGVTTGVWYHLCFERVGASAKIFIDGISQELTELEAFGTNDVGNLNASLTIARCNTIFFSGHLDELRISKGIARWTENFTPPTEEYYQEINTTFLTNFVSKLNVNKLIQTNLVTVFNRNLDKFLTNLTTRFNKTTIINTDLRTRSVEYTAIDPKPLTDIIVKKAGSELIDVDYSTLKIQFNLNRTPSNASFKLARHHDDLDHTLDGIDSEITDQNKIQIYDGIILLFTGYITQIKANSSDDTVDVVAEDIRCKINNTSMELSWGGKWDEDNNMQAITTGVALAMVMAEISSLITGYESIDFAYIPEYTTTVADCGSLIDNLVTNSANISWYVDENEYIRFTKVAQGIIKTLSLSSTDLHRHIYDTILNDISINKMTSDYYPSLKVKLGKTHTMQWIQSGTNPTLGFAPKNYVKDLTWFGFQNSSLDGQRYVGEGIIDIGGYITPDFSVVAYFVYQWLAIDTYTDIGSIIVGSGEPQKTIFMSSYGKKIANNYWEERPDPTVNVGAEEQICLYNVEEENYDYTGFAIDAANFELSQNNIPKTEANVTMILDAYEYYGINFKNLIELSNTLSSEIYSEFNGFPLNIDCISIDCATRIVSLSLTNYGKTYYEKIGNIMSNYKPTSYYKLGNKQPIIEV